MPLETLDFLATADVPHANGLVRTAGKDTAEVGSERDAVDDIGMAVEAAEFLAVGNVPQPYTIVATTRCGEAIVS